MERQLYPKDGHASGCTGVGVEDEELAELAKESSQNADKEKAPKNGEFFEA